MNSSTLMSAASLAVEGGRMRPSYVGIAAVQACSAPKTAAHGTTVSAAGFTLVTRDAQDAPGSPPREAPV